jgi:putative toxin-antitoxin system antitoxin component (TIGR02293 family)
MTNTVTGSTIPPYPQAADLLKVLQTPARQLVERVRRGLPFAELEALREPLGLSLQELAAYAGIPSRTLVRRRQAGRLDPAESERVLRIERLLALATEMLRDVERNLMLNPVHPGFADAVEIGKPQRLVLDRRLLKAAPTCTVPRNDDGAPRCFQAPLRRPARQVVEPDLDLQSGGAAAEVDRPTAGITQTEEDASATRRGLPDRRSGKILSSHASARKSERRRRLCGVDLVKLAW